MAIKKYNLKKFSYESSKTREILDEEFTEFLPKKRSISEFFDLYNSHFYKFLRTTHEYFITNSLRYIKTYINPKTITKTNLEEQLEELQLDIDSVEKSHPIIPNGSVLTPNTEDEWENLDDISLYYMQSGQLRQITDGTLLNQIKEFRKKSLDPMKDFLMGVDMEVINSVKHGKRIETEQDIYDSNYDINTYNTNIDT